MITEAELIKEFGMDASEIESLRADAAAYESGDWPSGKVVRRGRPGLPEEDKMKSVTFRLEGDLLREANIRSKALGISRSQFIRDAVNEKLAAYV